MKSLLELLPGDDVLEEGTPAAKNVFRAFALTKFKKVKVVILGQDPYPKPGRANGLAFATNDGTIPPSLRNVFKVAGIKQEIADTRLEGWAQQGVFLLNTALTLPPSGNHFKKWNPFISAVLEVLKNKRPEVKFLLWGREAHKMTEEDDTRFLKCSHPSPQGFNKTDRPFCDNKHFALTGINTEADINWNQTKLNPDKKSR